MTDHMGVCRFLHELGFKRALFLGAILGLGILQNGCSGVVSGKSSGGAPATQLTISNIAAASVTATAATLTWQTNLTATSQVEYGTTAAYGSNTPLDSTMVTSHQQSLSALKAGTLYHYRVHSSDAGNNFAVSSDLTFTTASSGGDTTPPSVSITSPANGSTVSGTIMVTANATDNVGVASVQFQFDGANLGAAVTAAPYVFSWDSTTTANGSHTLRAVAADTSNNTAISAGVMVTVSNTSNTAPSITSLSPTSGLVGASVTITGANFGATQGTSTVKFYGTTAVPTSWSATSILVPVPSGATTGSVVVTVGGAASNGVTFTVTPDTTAPVVAITTPANGATLSGTITLTATATDSDSPVSFVQFLIDGTNTGGQLTTSPYSLALDTSTLSNASHIVTAIAKDPAGNQGTSAGVTVTVANVTATGMGPLKQSVTNSHYFVDPRGKAVLLAGSQTWNTFQDAATGGSPVALDFTAYVNFLKTHGHNVTILWKKDLPTACNWGAAGGGTTWNLTPFAWQRTGGSSGTQVASDGLPAFDLTQFNQAYFDRLRARAQQLQQNGIYAIVQLFDGLGLTDYRCSNDGYPFSNGNNVNGIADGGGTGSMSMSAANAITDVQDAYVRKIIDTLNDLPNVLWEPSEEAPDTSTWWQGHMIALIRSYEAGKPLQHPIGYATLNISNTSDSNLYSSNADWVAPMARISPTSSCGSGTPQCKVNINDSDHSYFGMWNDSAQTNRTFIWENFTHGDSVMFMDPYVIYWPSGNRNLCSSPVTGVCSGPDSRWDNFRNNMGYMLDYANTKLDLVKMTPQGGLSSTGYCLAQTPSTGAEYLVYASNGGSFTVNLSATPRTLNVEWLNPSTGAIITGGTVNGGSASQSFTPPFSGDAVLYLVDAAGHN
jgi:hypothetical protein